MILLNMMLSFLLSFLLSGDPIALETNVDYQVGESSFIAYCSCCKNSERMTYNLEFETDSPNISFTVFDLKGESMGNAQKYNFRENGTYRIEINTPTERKVFDYEVVIPYAGEDTVVIWKGDPKPRPPKGN